MGMMKGQLRQQLEYYFSHKNLQSDTYLCSLMDSQGWVPLQAVAQFKRIQQMTGDLNLLAEALQGSRSVEVSRDGTCLRQRQGRPRQL